MRSIDRCLSISISIDRSIPFDFDFDRSIDAFRFRFRSIDRCLSISISIDRSMPFDFDRSIDRCLSISIDRSIDAFRRIASTDRRARDGDVVDRVVDRDADDVDRRATSRTTSMSSSFVAMCVRRERDEGFIRRCRRRFEWECKCKWERATARIGRRARGRDRGEWKNRTSVRGTSERGNER